MQAQLTTRRTSARLPVVSTEIMHLLPALQLQHSLQEMALDGTVQSKDRCPEGSGKLGVNWLAILQNQHRCHKPLHTHLYNTSTIQ